MKCLLFCLLGLCFLGNANAQVLDSLPDRSTFYQLDSLSKDQKLKEILALIPPDSLYSICLAYLKNEKQNDALESDTVNTTGKKDEGYAEIEWEALYFDFGKVKTDTVISKTITFSNIGTQPLLIQSIKTSCGCTILDYPKNPILPTQSSKLQVHFESKNRLGLSEQVFIVYDNSPQRRTILKFKVEVFSE